MTATGVAAGTVTTTRETTHTTGTVVALIKDITKTIVVATTSIVATTATSLAHHIATTAPAQQHLGELFPTRGRFKG